jgi:predicted DNA-binding transcriptional regulator YafY
MAKKRSAPLAPAHTVTADRAARLYRLLTLLGEGPQSRSGITRRLRLGIRGFYRDLEVLRIVGIVVELIKGRYTLKQAVGKSLDQLPFPDPALNLGEARQLAKGRTPAHRKLRKQIDAIVK